MTEDKKKEIKVGNVKAWEEQYLGHPDPVGRRGRQGGVHPDITTLAEENLRNMPPPYYGEDLITSFENGFIAALKMVRGMIDDYINPYRYL